MSADRGKLGNFLAEVIQWQWDEFVKAEISHEYTGYQATVLALVRTCSEGKLGAIKLAIDRVDGKLETPVKIETPKIWFVFPDATSVADLPPGETPKQLASPESLPDAPQDSDEEEKEEAPVVMSLRETLHKLADSPRMVTTLILEMKKKVEDADGNLGDSEEAAKKIPMVKSVIAANLLKLANEKGNFEAITEVFDQIDGKLVETIRLLGDDIFLTQYALEAPYGAVKNKKGIYMIAADQTASIWEEKLREKHGKR